MVSRFGLMQHLMVSTAASGAAMAVATRENLMLGPLLVLVAVRVLVLPVLVLLLLLVLVPLLVLVLLMRAGVMPGSVLARLMNPAL